MFPIVIAFFLVQVVKYHLTSHFAHYFPLSHLQFSTHSWVNQLLQKKLLFLTKFSYFLSIFLSFTSLHFLSHSLSIIIFNLIIIFTFHHNFQSNFQGLICFSVSSYFVLTNDRKEEASFFFLLVTRETARKEKKMQEKLQEATLPLFKSYYFHFPHSLQESNEAKVVNKNQIKPSILLFQNQILTHLYK